MGEKMKQVIFHMDLYQLLVKSYKTKKNRTNYIIQFIYNRKYVLMFITILYDIVDSPYNSIFDIYILKKKKREKMRRRKNRRDTQNLQEFCSGTMMRQIDFLIFQRVSEIRACAFVPRPVVGFYVRHVDQFSVEFQDPFTQTILLQNRDKLRVRVCHSNDLVGQRLDAPQDLRGRPQHDQLMVFLLEVAYHSVQPLRTLPKTKCTRRYRRKHVRNQS